MLRRWRQANAGISVGLDTSAAISRFSSGGSGDGGGVLCGGGSLMGTQAEEDLEGLARSIIAFKLN